MIRLAQWMGKLIMPRNGLAAFLAHGIARLMTLTPGLRSLIVDVKIKPKNRFARGLFVPSSGGDRFEHGNHLAQGQLRKATGEFVRSDDALGNQLQLIGIGVDPLMKLSTAQCQAWRALGGHSITIHAPGSTDQRENVWIDVDNTFSAAEPPNGWVIAVRPDKVVMADGAPADAGRIVDEVAQLLG